MCELWPEIATREAVHSLSDLHAEFETFEVPKDLGFELAVLAGDIMAPGLPGARWLRNAQGSHGLKRFQLPLPRLC
ncbi:hypothetical protein J2W35_000603 [Variovorax boronicumulans]|nr:hypothetical protein [Variovorax boronicumulans]